MDEKEYHSFARIDVRSSLYARIAMKSFVQFEKSIKALNKLGAQKLPDEDGYDSDINNKIGELDFHATESGFSVIIYSSMCFEAAIYDFAAGYFGASYVDDHLDKLNVLSKWLIIPKLTWQRELRKNAAPYQHLVRLVRARNRLVHHKSEQLKVDDHIQIERFTRRHAEFMQDVQDSIKALILVSLEMDWLSDPPQSINPLPHFGKINGFPRWIYPPELTSLVADCKRIFSNSLPKNG